MKIYVVKTPESLQPGPQSFKYPAHNDDYGVEQDFELWLFRNKELITSDAREADWHYLPVYWTRWYILHNFGTVEKEVSELKEMVVKCLIDPLKTFTISQFDGGTLMPELGLKEFTAAKTTNIGIDIPILCRKHKAPIFPVRKKFLASFNGSYTTHPLRLEMKERLQDNKQVCIGGTLPTPFLKRVIQGKQFNLNTLASYIALCPRGTSLNSFRFFESMQLGVAPCLIGDEDVRPFKRFINWSDYSYYVNSINDLDTLLNSLDKKEAIKKGRDAHQFYLAELDYQKWCKYIIKELND